VPASSDTAIDAVSAVAGGELSEADLHLVLEGIDLSVRRLRPVSAMRVA
jgi:hypothetical protein